VSIHPDDEFSLRTRLEIELGDVVPNDGLADAIITRYRRGRRRMVGAIGLVIVFAGIGVPLGLGATTPSDPSHTVLRLATYTLTLPGQYQLVAARSAPCRPLDGSTALGAVAVGHQQAGADVAAAADPPGRCIVVFLTPPFRPKEPGSRGDPNIPHGARGITVGRYHAWLIPNGSGRPGGVALVIEGAARGKVTGQIQDLVINSTGISRAALVSAVSAGLS
jgi:hypothetical protein